MASGLTAGQRFRSLLETERPLQIVGCINAYSALMAKDAGFQAIYLSGAGVANACFGLPDLGMTSLTEVVTEIGRLTSAVDLPLLVDADTGWGHELCIARTVQEFSRAGAAGLHIEDQSAAKRCGHRPNKSIVETAEMVSRIEAAVSARTDESCVIMARTDALATEGVNASIDRCQQYVQAGADMIFAEALSDLSEYRRFTESLPVPVLANMTEFGKTPLLDLGQFREAGVDMVLYPLSAFRAMNQAAETVYQAIRREGSQENVLPTMQTRDRLYEVLRYRQFEERLDKTTDRT